MPKINPYNLRPKPRRAHTRTFHDADSGQDVALTFRRLTTPEATLAFERGDTLIREYITGDPDDPTVEVTPFPSVGDEIVRLSETLLRNASTLESMQPEDSPDKYSAEDFVALSAGLGAETWAEIMGWVKQVNTGVADGLKNPPAAQETPT